MSPIRHALAGSERADERRLRRVLRAIATPAADEEFLRQSLPARSARKAAEVFRDILAQPNVVGTGIAEKRKRGRGTGQLALAVYVAKKGDAPASRSVPPFIPASLAGLPYPTDVVELGHLHPQFAVETASLQSGISVGRVDSGAGTIGAILGPANAPRILSNSHVLARSGLGAIGDPIICPGREDGGREPQNLVAVLSTFVPFDADGVNRMDVALATVLPEYRAALDATIAKLAVLPGVIRPAMRGMRVTKVGRTSGKTTGEVRDVDFAVEIDYGTGVGKVRFGSQVLCSGFTSDGDSGALVLEESTLAVLGLHFAGHSKASAFSPMRPILRAVGGRFWRAAAPRGGVTASEANRARRKALPLLRELGAHAVSVEAQDRPATSGSRRRKRAGRQAESPLGFSVVAWFNEPPTGDLPDVEIKAGGRTKRVPLTIRVTEQFRPQ